MPLQLLAPKAPRLIKGANNNTIIRLKRRQTQPAHISSVRKGSNELTALKVDDVTLRDDLEIAENLNSYFLTVFTSEDYRNFPTYI